MRRANFATYDVSKIPRIVYAKKDTYTNANKLENQLGSFGGIQDKQGASHHRDSAVSDELFKSEEAWGNLCDS